jgi:hypothetical protein
LGKAHRIALAFQPDARRRAFREYLMAALLDVPLVQAAQNVVPVAVTAAESVGRLREWASGRCLSADQAGVYAHRQQASGRRRRRVYSDPSAN